MPTPNPRRYVMTQAEVIHRAAVMLDSCGQVLYKDWPETDTNPGLEGVEVVRQMTRTLAHLLNSLVDADPVAQSKHLHELDDLFVTIPNGNTTPGTE